MPAERKEEALPTAMGKSPFLMLYGGGTASRERGDPPC